MYLSGSSTTSLTSCTLTSNWAGRSGGALCLKSSSAASLASCSLQSNSADYVRVHVHGSKLCCPCMLPFPCNHGLALSEAALLRGLAEDRGSVLLCRREGQSICSNTPE